MFNAIKFSAIKYVPLVLAAVLTAPASAQDDQEIYDGAVNCSALHSFLSGMSIADDDEAAAAEFEDIAVRFLIIAMARNEAEAAADMASIADEIVELVQSAKDEAEIEEFLEEGITRCDAFREIVAEEYDAVDTSE